MPGLTGCEGQSRDRSFRTRPAPFPPRVSSVPLIPVTPPPTHPPTHRRSFLFHFYHAASIMTANSSSCIGGDPLADPNSHSNSTTPPTVTVSAPPADKLNLTASTSADRPASPNTPAGHTAPLQSISAYVSPPRTHSHAGKGGLQTSAPRPEKTSLLLHSGRRADSGHNCSPSYMTGCHITGAHISGY